MIEYGNFSHKNAEETRRKSERIGKTCTGASFCVSTLEPVSHGFSSPYDVLLQGNPATSGCCSKCWRDNLKKQGASEAASPVVKKPQPVEEHLDSPMPDAKPEDEIKPVEAPAAEAPKKKKGKKKLSYKAMMKDMMVAQSADEKAEKEKDALRKVTGGGAFQKIEKI